MKNVLGVKLVNIMKYNNNFTLTEVASIIRTKKKAH